MKVERKKHLNTLSKALRKINTHPGIQATLISCITQGLSETIKSTKTVTTLTECYIVQALVEQIYFGENTMAKGLLVTSWQTAQCIWKKEKGEKCDGDKWAVGVIRSLHTFSQAMWCSRNEFFHGLNKTDQNEIAKAKYRKRITELYQRSRKNLTLVDKKMFQLPLHFRKKGTANGMRAWIERVEMIFQYQDQDDEGNLDTKYWFFPKTKKWRLQKNEIT